MKRLLNATAVVVASSLLLAACGGGSDDETVTAAPGDDMADKAAMEVMEADNAINMANNAAAALDDMSDADAVAAVERLITAAEGEIADLPAADQTAEMARLQPARTEVMQHQTRLDTAMTEAQMEAAEEARKMAAKLFGAIDAGEVEDHVMIAADLKLGEEGQDPAEQRTLKKSVVAAALGDWAGQQYASSDKKHNATVYSMMGDPTMGAKFEDAGDLSLASNGEYTVSGHADKIVITGFSRTSGTEEYKLSGDTQNRIRLPGSFDGVDGNYYCDPAGDACTATVANANGKGIDLSSGDVWTFKPNNPEDRVTESPGATYAFGWWLDESGTKPVVRVFTNPDADVAIADLRGSAKYTGAAAGKYSLNRGQGVDNDSGHFTANAELTATFDTASSIEGTVNGFVGADGESRDDWSVDLKSITLGSTGAANGAAMTTVWTIGDEEAGAVGKWSGLCHRR